MAASPQEDDGKTCWAGFYREPGHMVMEQTPRPTLEGCMPGTVLLEALYTTICGSDMLYINQPREIDHCAGASIHEAIARIVDLVPTDEPELDNPFGLTTDQIVLALPSNYLHSGIFRDVPPERAQALREGVKCTGGMSQYFIGHASHCYPIPSKDKWGPGVELHHLTAAQPLGTILWMGRQLPNLLHKTVLVLGQGQNGQLATHLMASMGARRIIAADVLPERLAISTHMGATDIVQIDPEDSAKAVAEVQRLTSGAGADVVLEMVGHQDSTINLCIEMVAPSGLIMAFGVPGNSLYGSFAFATLFRKNAKLQGSVFPCAHEDFPFAVELLAQGRIKAGPIFNTDPFSLEHAPDAFSKSLYAKHTVMKVIIEMQRDMPAAIAAGHFGVGSV
ncbi:uncharacterized protein MONBRDRAFT_29895 [Monosiga brevicollis MX1]|uniref:Alcohol dehydrogenase-like C-terminal domain-containing protein n=1 Tax=Monosiga brevicollis TaxID=81824 RepID=A9VCF8_MONBE|nr:uncharacterized protein MONBRDRAFT_29895 [Monosiga brevicollis MX1]EDQ84741.1 predicted protein [Monosiga brevicollis MX1]|eukprot:XP_001750391.1 hypothetical protein [Monosiga brevicollis MX1]